jgi:hypothetical protein
MSKLEQALDIYAKLKQCRDTLYKFFTVIKSTGEQEYQERIGLFQCVLDGAIHKHGLPGILQAAIKLGNETEDGMEMINIFAAAYEDQSGNDYREYYLEKRRKERESGNP